MSSFFKKKSGKPDDEGSQASQPEAGGQAPPATPPAEEKKGFFKKKAPAKPRQPKEPKPPKEHKSKKPLFGKKKEAPEVPAAEPAALEAPAPGPPAGAPVTAAKAPRENKSFFKKKGAREPRPPKEAKPGKKAREPKPPKEGKRAKGGGFGGSKVSPVGLDLGRSSIAAVRLRHNTGGDVLLQAALDQLPEGLIQEGEVRDVEALAFAIRDFWKAHKIRGRKVSIGLANQKIVVRSLDFPLLEEKELRSAIEFQAQDYIPIPIEEAVFDYHILGRYQDEQGIEKQKVLVVAAQKDMVMDFVNAIKKARLNIAGIDLQAFAMLRALVTHSFLDEGMPAQAVAVANIASDVTNLVVDVAGEPQFTRIISFGGDDFTRAVQEQLGNTFSEAEVYKVRTGLAAPGVQEEGAEAESGFPEAPAGAPGEQPPAAEAPTGIIPPGEALEGPPGGEGEGPAAAPGEEEGGGGTPFGAHGLTPDGPGKGEGPGAPGEPENPGGASQGAGGPPPEEGKQLWPEGNREPEEAEIEEVTRRALEIAADSLADEIRRSLDYYMSQEQSMPVSKLLLSGGGAMMPNLESYLSQIFPFPVVMGNPLQRITQNKSGLSDEEMQVLAPRLAIAIGLSLEDEG